MPIGSQKLVDAIGELIARDIPDPANRTEFLLGVALGAVRQALLDQYGVTDVRAQNEMLRDYINDALTHFFHKLEKLEKQRRAESRRGSSH